MKQHIWIINGPNLNLLGTREPDIYGHISFEEYFKYLKEQFPDIDLSYFQSNHEGALIDKIQEIGFSCTGIILNPAAYTHTSIALADTIKAITAPVIEVHISNLQQRESFRQVSFIRPHCTEYFTGFGLSGYEMAIKKLLYLD